MNSIHLHNISKKFGQQLIFSGITTEISDSNHTAIIGYNGSGKSTLLQIITGYVSPTAGHVQYLVNSVNIPIDDVYKYISFSAPYLDLVEEFTALETVEFYKKFKNTDESLTAVEILDIAMLGQAASKQVKFFSSGMKQRLKLILAMVSDVPFVFLDEPISNLDKPGISWYREMIARYAKNKTLVISSNDLKEEMDFCVNVLRIEDFKTL